MKNPWEKHLTEECGLRIIDPMKATEPEYTAEEMDYIDQFPPENQTYDFVLSTKTRDKLHAQLELTLKLKKFALSPVGKLFHSTGRWCLRVRSTK